jgi:hypothetical protein
LIPLLLFEDIVANTKRKNAIEKRIDDMVAMWNEFADNDQARLCRWLVQQDELDMVDVFVESQNSEAGEIPDLIVRFETPFQSPNQYGFALAASLHEQYEKDREGMKEEGIPSDWVCDKSRPGETDIAAFVRTCESLRTYYDYIEGHFVAYLVHSEISDMSSWIAWLLRLIQSELPSHMRMMVVDLETAPVFDKLCEAQPIRAVTVEPQLDMPGAMQELARAGNPAEPGVGFRKQFVALTNAAGKGDLDKVRRAGRAALAIATEQGWPQMKVVAHMAMGAAFLGAGKMADALQSYRSAGQVSSAAKEDGDPAGSKLEVQSGMAEGAALIADKDYAEAAKAYRRTAPLAAAAEDHLSAMECWRMAEYCHENLKEFPEAWSCGCAALESAKLLDEEMRLNTTVPYVGQAMLRITKHRQYRDQEQAVRQRMVELVGEDWEDKLEKGAGKS